MPAQVVRTLVLSLDPTGIGDLVLKVMFLAGITCFLRPNSYHLFKWKHLEFGVFEGEEGDLKVDILLSVPDLKSVAYASAVGGGLRTVGLREFAIPDLCVVRHIVALETKMGVFDSDLHAACADKRFVVKTSHA